LEDASAESLHAFVRDCIEPGSTIHTDSWRGYAGLETKGYQRKITASRDRRKKECGLMPRVRQIALLLKQWRAGTHQGSAALKHLPYYLDEFTFRFNLRKSKSPGRLFLRLMQQAVKTPPATYAMMVTRQSRSLKKGVESRQLFDGERA
jgi:transposase-like protein